MPDPKADPKAGAKPDPKADANADTKPDPKADTKPDPKAEGPLDAARATKLIAAKVRVPEIDGDGKRHVIERDATAADIFAIHQRGGRTTVVTVDGQKFEIA